MRISFGQKKARSSSRVKTERPAPFTPRVDARACGADSQPMNPPQRRHTGPLDAFRPLDKAYRAVRRAGRWPVGTVYEGVVEGERTPVTILFPETRTADVGVFLQGVDAEVARGKQFFGLPIQGPLFGGETSDRRPFVILPDARGPNLERKIETDGPLKPVAALQVGVVIADALTRLHRRGGALGELRPWTILLPATRKQHLRLLDLAIARGMFAKILQPPSQSPWFSAPSVQAGRAPTATADVHALGSILYYMVTGLAPGPSRQPLPSKAARLGPFGTFIDGLVLRAVEAGPAGTLPPLRGMAEFARALRGLRDLLLVTPDAQRAILDLRAESRGLRPPKLPGVEAAPMIGFLDTAGPSYLTDSELSSIEEMLKNIE